MWIKQDTISVLESSEGQGWKVVASNEPPQGGRDSGNWVLLYDGLTYKAASTLATMLREVLKCFSSHWVDT